MEKYIPLNALAAEMERKYNQEVQLMEKQGYTKYHQGLRDAYKCILSSLDTLEVKEVDLEKHLKEDIEDVFFDLNGVAVKGATHYLTVEDVKDIAKHFYELGIKAQKGEEV